MAKLSADTVVISDGDIKLYKRRNSSVWQAKFKIDSRWVRVSTEQRKLDEAKAQAKEQIVEYKIKQRNQIPVVTKTFGSVAKLAIAEMQEELKRGTVRAASPQASALFLDLVQSECSGESHPSSFATS